MHKFNEQFSALRELLIPFTAMGEKQLDLNQKWSTSTGYRTLLSLAAIKAHPAFASSDPKAATEWAMFFAGANTGNDRFHLDFPKPTAKNQPTFGGLRSFIEEFGDLLVEHHLLNP